MEPDLQAWLPRLEPPPGGVARLRRSLAEREREAAAGADWRLAAVCALVVLALSPMLGRELGRWRRDRQIEQRILAAVERPPATRLDLPSTDPDVRLALLLPADGRAGDRRP